MFARSAEFTSPQSQDALRQLVQALRDETSNLPPMPGIFSDYPAPIVRTGADDTRELVKVRGGMPPRSSR